MAAAMSPQLTMFVFISGLSSEKAFVTSATRFAATMSDGVRVFPISRPVADIWFRRMASRFSVVW